MVLVGGVYILAIDRLAMDEHFPHTAMTFILPDTRMFIALADPIPNLQQVLQERRPRVLYHLLNGFIS